MEEQHHKNGKMVEIHQTENQTNPLRRWPKKTVVLFGEYRDLGDDHEFDSKSQFQEYKESEDILFVPIFTDGEQFSADSSLDELAGWMYQRNPGNLQKRILSDMEDLVYRWNAYLQGNIYDYVAKESIECPHCKRLHWTEVDRGHHFVGNDHDRSELVNSLPLGFEEVGELFSKTSPDTI